MTFKKRVVRTVATLAIAGVVSAQIPIMGGSALAVDDCFTNEIGDNSGNFLGIKNLSNKDVITGVTFGLVAYALTTTISDARGAGAAAGAVGSGGAAAGGGAGAGAGKLPVTPPGDKEKPIFDVVAENKGDFSSLKSLIEQAELDKTLKEEGPYTFFAPTNMALGGVSGDTLASLTSDKTKLANFLRKHIVSGRYTINELKALPEGKQLLTLSGETVSITKDGGLKINGVPIVENDIAASNGWVHPISGVIP